MPSPSEPRIIPSFSIDGSWLGAVAVVAMFLMLAGVASAQYRPWPAQMPSEPAWGDYDTGHTWRDAGWWWQNQPAWAGEHHPEWWGDFDDEHAWHPAWWWWRNDAGWVRDHHPEWWGDEYQGDWYPAPWWYQYASPPT